MDTLTLRVLGRGVRIHCEDPRARALLGGSYDCFRRDAPTVDLTYTAGRCRASSGFSLRRDGQEPLLAADDAELLFLFETDVSTELQKLRADLYFLHSAVVEFGGKGVLLVAGSGGGKSTTSWGLVHHGFRYLSDELAPVDPGTLKVHPYPRALCLKARPPGPYPLPAPTLRTSRTLHIPAEGIPGQVGDGAVPVAAVFFVSYHPEAPGPAVEPVSRAEAAARLLAHALNPLAHAGEGLDPAIRIAGAVARFRLRTGPLPVTAALVKTALGRDRSA